MNSYDLKVLIEETKKNTARSIIRELSKMQSECVDKEAALNECLKGKAMSISLYNSEMGHIRGYSSALDDAIRNIEEDYNVGAWNILENSNLE